MGSTNEESQKGNRRALSRLALLGVGYIGGSAAMAAKREGLVGEVVGYDVDVSALSSALNKGVVDTVAETAEEAVKAADLILLAAPVCRLDSLVAAIAGVIPKSALVMDVGSVKRDFVERTSQRLPLGCLIGCHPMAGAEFTGVAASDPSIFPGRLCYICPPDGVPEGSVERAVVFWSGLGCRVERIEPALHDRLMALQSHLPHVAAFALAASMMEDVPFLESVGAPATTSLRDTSRIAASSPTVWRDILLANANELLPLVRRLGNAISAIEAAMANRDCDKLEGLLTTGQSARRRVVKS